MQLAARCACNLPSAAHGGGLELNPAPSHPPHPAHVAWHGPFVMTTDEEIRKTIADYRSGNFPPVRVPWDYKRLSTFPKDKLPK